MSDTVTLTDDQWLGLKQLRGLLWIAIEDAQDRLSEIDELIGEVEASAQPSRSS